MFGNAGREHMEGDAAIAERVITPKASERIARVAFALARRRAAAGRPAVLTIVHKANVLSLTDGLFRDCCRRVAAAYPEIEVREMLVDTPPCLVRDGALRRDRHHQPVRRHLSDEAAGLVGGKRRAIIISAAGGGVRAGARLRADMRRQRHRQSWARCCQPRAARPH
jgi:isocitrate dehydrogenase